LAEAELEYDDQHTCTAAFVKMPFQSLPAALSAKGVSLENANALIWTTTPWTLPANKAVAFNRDIEYTVVRIHQPEDEKASQDECLLAKDRIEHVLSFLPEGSTVEIVVDSIYGSELEDEHASCANMFQHQEHRSRFISADFVTATSGTGLVHMAPGHGMEDYQVCQKYGIGPAFAPVDDEGRFTAEAFPAYITVSESVSSNAESLSLTGLFAEKEGARKVLDIIKGDGNGLLLVAHKFTHKNPIDWRTKQPVITRATAQWFADVSLIKDRALAAIEDVKFVPETGRNRLKAFIEGRSQWCISRQRAWGVPIPALYHVETGEACIADDSINHIISVIQERGTDPWFSDAADDPVWLHSSLEPGKWTRGKDTMDVWFDSGTTWTSLAPREQGKPVADVYVEGSDQHRGWFQSSLLTAIATQDPTSKPVAPYRTLLTHGFILDGEGRKMSKSIGNTISPAEIVSGSLLLQQPKAKAGKNGKVATEPPKSKKKQDSLGPDLLRLWVASSDYTKDVPISQQGLVGIQQSLQKYRVTMKFLCGVLQDYQPDLETDTEGSSPMPFASKIVLHQLSRTSEAVFSSYRSYHFHEGVRKISSFVNADLSAFYFEIAKDLLYTGTAAQRSQAQQVLYTIMREMHHWLSPITPHLVQEMSEHLPETLAKTIDPFHQVWSQPYAAPADTQSPDMRSAFKSFDHISRAVKLAQEQARSAGKLGSGLACRVVIVGRQESSGAAAGLAKDLAEMEDELASLLVVSEAQTEWSKEPESLNIISEQPEGEAWRFEAPVELRGADGEAVVVAKVQVLPPLMSKCVRCWQYTAADEETPCGRCQVALAEKGIAV
jgi:isoleucyl-tRNA synthetase